MEGEPETLKLQNRSSSVPFKRSERMVFEYFHGKRGSAWMEEKRQSDNSSCSVAKDLFFEIGDGNHITRYG
jgi:hypothetical protein